MKETIHIHLVIDKDITCCADCPLYDTEPNMGATLSICKGITSGGWDNVLEDITWRNDAKAISSQCPYKKGEVK